MKFYFSRIFVYIFEIVNSPKYGCHRRQKYECDLIIVNAREVGLVLFCREASRLPFAHFRCISLYGSLQNCNEIFQRFIMKKY